MNKKSLIALSAGFVVALASTSIVHARAQGTQPEAHGVVAPAQGGFFAAPPAHAAAPHVVEMRERPAAPVARAHVKSKVVKAKVAKTKYKVHKVVKRRHSED